MTAKEILDFIYSQGQVDLNMGNEADQVEAAVQHYLSEKVESGEISKSQEKQLLAKCLRTLN